MDNIVVYNTTFKNFVVPYQIMVKYLVIKLKPNGRSVSSRTFAMLVISVSMIPAIIILSTVTNESFAQGSNDNNNFTE
jgi:hypothetical protein